MPAKILVTLSVWFLLSMIVGLLVGRAISTLQKVPTPGFAPALETDWATRALHELEAEEMWALLQAQMQEVC